MRRWMALHDVVMRGDVAKIKTLVAQGMDVDAMDHTGWSPLHTAAYVGDVEAVKTLVALGANKEQGDQVDRVRIDAAAPRVTEWARGGNEDAWGARREQGGEECCRSDAAVQRLRPRSDGGGEGADGAARGHPGEELSAMHAAALVALGARKEVKSADDGAAQAC